MLDLTKTHRFYPIRKKLKHNSESNSNDHLCKELIQTKFNPLPW